MKKNLTRILVLILYTFAYFYYVAFSGWSCRDNVICLKEFFSQIINFNFGLASDLFVTIPFLVSLILLWLTINSLFNKKKITILWLIIFIIVNLFMFYSSYQLTRFSPPESANIPCVPNTPGCE